jgi:hypothetical protein
MESGAVMRLLITAVITALIVSTGALAEDPSRVVPQAVTVPNEPCTGKKGGISHCQGDAFICNDGSKSASNLSFLDGN